jgi:hypothetical protein
LIHRSAHESRRPGPYIYLQTVSDLLTNAGAKGSFFFNGNNYDCIYNSESIARVKYAYNAGHMIGDHTWAHADLTTLNNAQIEDAMFRMEEAFSRIIGVKPAFMRPPFGSYNDNIRSIAIQRGQNLALWDWDTGDADGNTTAQSKAVYQDAVNDRVSNMLVLNHETEREFPFNWVFSTSDDYLYSWNFEYRSSVRYQASSAERLQSVSFLLFRHGDSLFHIIARYDGGMSRCCTIQGGRSSAEANCT